MVAGFEDVAALVGDDRPDRHAAAQPLGKSHHIGLHILVLPGEHLAGAADARLHFVKHQQQVVLVADLAQGGQVARVGDVDAALALQRLDQNRRRLRADRGANRGDIVERHVAEAVDAAERLAVARGAGRRDRG